jgi:uncharacterized OB-fold protein
MFGQVYIKDNKYKLKGAFHRMSQNCPIRNADKDWKLAGITNPRDMTYIHSYGGEAIFFESLCQGTLLATRCDSGDCGSLGTVYMPFRIYCPDCLAKTSIIDLTTIAKQTAKIHTFMVCERSGAFNLLDKPIQFINIEFDGVATILMSYLSIGTPAIGMRVIPIFRKNEPTFTILDLSWVAEGTAADKLPQGFSF